MSEILESEIREQEDNLRRAMLSSDIARLDQALAENLIFTNHLGQRVDKCMDLEAHKAGLLRLTSIELSGQRILVSGQNTAVVSVKADIEGTYSGHPAGGRFAFTRVWSKDSGQWQVIAAHSGIVA
ncbi:nuclear transport factor 2 family protein [Marinobacter zhejiangensis]|uniref:DUF4440 domain-containing protein n=1 Tax=Marinobacter zhejiangensis TaxID=488535 RepID=A0A1I4P3K4_9GAMM|nr:nuclear transport factor 2 family protein [Marinobacter zhejiangensis]SFM22372.1 protein of unknown function [Marinobacter zhejiangensis]